MIQSMTGYGKAVAAYGEKKICVEIKTLNSKALDINVHTPPLYREKEMEIRQMVGGALERGKVDFLLYADKDASAGATPINAALVEAYYRQITDISKATGIPLPDDWFSLLLRLPDVLERTEMDVLCDEEWTAAREIIAEALDRVREFRVQEGAALERKFNEKLDNIERLLESLEPYEKGRVEKIRGRIIESLTALPEVEYDANRLEQELIYYIEKLDISEEKQRLANHLRYFRETMADGHGQGKKLGFITQEMGREINTTGSKSNNAEMQNIVVKMKDELEQIKEQVLNVL